MTITLDHLDDKNPGLLLNAIGVLNKVIDTFPQVLEDCLIPLMERLATILDTKRAELSSVVMKFMGRLNSRLDEQKMTREYLRLLGGGFKCKAEVVQLLTLLLRERQGPLQTEPTNTENEESLPVIASSLASAMVKVLSRLCAERGAEGAWGQRMRELVGVCAERWGEEFVSKSRSHPKLESML